MTAGMDSMRSSFCWVRRLLVMVSIPLRGVGVVEAKREAANVREPGGCDDSMAKKFVLHRKNPRRKCEGNRQRPSRQPCGEPEKLSEGEAVRFATGFVMLRDCGESGIQVHGRYPIIPPRFIASARRFS